MKIYKTLLFLIAMMVMFSCGNSYVLSSEQLEELLVDMHLAEGMAIESSGEFKELEDKLDLYSTVYSKHGTDKAHFDSSMVYYSQNLGDLGEIYERVYNRILALEVDVKGGNYAPTTSFLDRDVLARIVDQDMDILPFVQQELWGRTRSYTFKEADFSKGKTETILLDSLNNNKVEMRYMMESDSLTSATCVVTMVFEDDKNEEKSFDIPVADSSLIKHVWMVDESPIKIIVKFTAVSMNDNASLSLNDLRLYDVASESHEVSLFQ